MRALSLTIVLVAVISSALGGCLDRLESSPSSFDACRGDVLCFAFIFERVFINFDTSLTAAQITANHEATLTPFPCRNYREFGLSGLCFDILSLVSDGSEMCVLAGRPVMRKKQDKVDSKGDGCTFNAMTNYLRKADTPGTAAEGINLAFLSILLFSPTRTPPIAIPSMPLLEQPMVRSRAQQDSASCTLAQLHLAPRRHAKLLNGAKKRKRFLTNRLNLLSPATGRRPPPRTKSLHRRHRSMGGGDASIRARRLARHHHHRNMLRFHRLHRRPIPPDTRLRPSPILRSASSAVGCQCRPQFARRPRRRDKLPRTCLRAVPYSSSYRFVAF